MPWGHAANRGTRRLCRHLFGERADELDKVWVLRGVGVNYDLCCADCARDGGRPELALACEGCAARADGDRLSVVGVIGEPEIRRRPEPVTGTLTRSPLPAGAVDVAPLDSSPGQWLVLTREHLIRWHAGTGEVIGRWEISLPATGPERKGGKAARCRLHAAPGGQCAAVVVDYRHHGIVIDLTRGRTTMTLDRGTCHVGQTRFPATFVGIDGQVLLVHATAWNRVDLSDPETGLTVTPRAWQRFPPHYLDYFYGHLLPSPGGSRIVSDGWAWHPVGVPRAWAIRPWRHEYVAHVVKRKALTILLYAARRVPPVTSITSIASVPPE